MRSRKKESKRPLVVGFTVTIAVLFSVFFGLVFLRPGIPTGTIPNALPHYGAVWGPYVPDNALLFGYENYTAIRQYNSSYPTQYSTLLNILDLKLKLHPAAINSVLTVSFASPNESVAFAFVDQAAFNNFTSALSNVNYSRVQAGGNGMYYVRNDENGRIQLGWLGIIPAERGIAFAVGNSDAKQALFACLTLNPADSLIAQLNVRQMLYVANGTAGHLALGIQHFPGLVPSANNTLTVVNYVSSRVQINRVLEFNSTNVALSQYSTVRQSYLKAHQFVVYSSYVLAMEYESLSDLSGAVRLVE